MKILLTLFFLLFSFPLFAYNDDLNGKGIYCEMEAYKMENTGPVILYMDFKSPDEYVNDNYKQRKPYLSGQKYFGIVDLYYLELYEKEEYDKVNPTYLHTYNQYKLVHSKTNYDTVVRSSSNLIEINTFKGTDRGLLNLNRETLRVKVSALIMKQLVNYNRFFDCLVEKKDELEIKKYIKNLASKLNQELEKKYYQNYKQNNPNKSKNKI